MKLTIKGAQRKLDKLWRTIGKESAKCEVCETLATGKVNYNQLHPHHIIGRRNKRLRWELRNRVWLCPTHHTLGKQCAEYNQLGWFWDKSGDSGWMGTYRKADKRYLEKVRNEIVKWKLPDYVKLIEELGGGKD